jgi:hypothetical protein
MNKRERRALSEMGVGYVPCEVTGRYLAFRLDSAGCGAGRELITLSVMTPTEHKDGLPVKSRRLCSLVIQRRDIERALSSVRPNNESRPSGREESI